MAIYLKRRRTTIEEWRVSPLIETYVETNSMSIWPESDEEPNKTGVLQPANLSQVAPDVESYSEKDTDGCEDQQLSK